jgi:hypothetical protein
MEEIICPQCGRPNLIEAEKCWYCQTILEKNMGENKEKSSVIPKAIDDEVEKKIVPEYEEQSNQNIPDWLKRVRDLKEADQPPEERDPNWQQQDLFISKEKPQKQEIQDKKQSSMKEKTAHPNTKKGKKDDQLLQTEQKKQSKQTSDADIQKKHAMKNLNKDSETLSDELPEGFTKL